jgi:hypothetical protein
MIRGYLDAGPPLGKPPVSPEPFYRPHEFVRHRSAMGRTEHCANRADQAGESFAAPPLTLW